MNLDEAKTIANKWAGLLAPVCERVEIAGSIRRSKPEVKDIEIVCIPKVEKRADLFGMETIEENMLETYLGDLAADHAIRLMKNGPRYKKISLVDGIDIDLFIVLKPAQWGVIYLIRTGPAEYSHRVVTRRSEGGLLPSYLRVKDGAVWSNNHAIETPEEADVYALLGLEYREPEERR